jgi:hypothetical protein
MSKCKDCGKELKNPLANICLPCLQKIYPTKKRRKGKSKK